MILPGREGPASLAPRWSRSRRRPMRGDLIASAWGTTCGKATFSVVQSARCSPAIRPWRAWLGIGVGDYEEEARGSGLPFPPLQERYERLEELLQICLRMWQGEQGDERPYEGKYYHIERPLNLPQSLTRPHPPILIAGSGEQKTLRLVARYADACNLRPGPQVPQKLEVLRQHCEAEGRDYDAIEKTCAFAFDVGEDGSKVSELIGHLRWLASMGSRRSWAWSRRSTGLSPSRSLVGRSFQPSPTCEHE